MKFDYNTKSEKGITLVVLIISIIIMLIITATIAINISSYAEKRNFTNLQTDMKILKEKVDIYYSENSSLPICNKYTKNKMEEIKLLEYTSVNDGGNYYVIDLNKLDLNPADLNFGKDYEKITDKSIDINNYEDIFVINEESHTVYYPKGIYMNGRFYYNFNDEDEIVEYADISAKIVRIEESKDHLFSIKSSIKILGGRKGMDKTNCKYVYTRGSAKIGTDGNLYTDGSLTQILSTVETAKGAGEWYLHVLAVDNEGNRTEVVSDRPVTVSSYVDYEYTGSEQTANLAPGTYKLETWGAQGGNVYKKFTNRTYDGGYGAYSTGILNLNENDNLYINVGGAGDYDSGTEEYHKFINGGYNGGGNASVSYQVHSYSAGSGGGATHIATKSGELKSLESNITEVLIVSGGGGGALSYYDNITPANSTVDYLGSGGGISGNSPLHTEYGENYADNIMPTGGTQNAGGYGYSSGAFGQGSISNTSMINECIPGGGGGLYGGASNIWMGASGGSGYIGNELLTDKHMAGYNVATSNEESTKTISVSSASEEPIPDCAKKGNGFARITNLNSDEIKQETGVTITLKNSRKYLFTIEAEVSILGGIKGETRFIYTNSKDEIGTDMNLYIEGILTKSSTTIEKAKGPGTYYMHVLTPDSNGMMREYVSEYPVTVASTADFFYSGTEQTASLAPGKYKLETWGAQGGAGGGKGGYATGIISLEEIKQLYVNVGGKGTDGNVSNTALSRGVGGYNGGGNGGAGNEKDDGTYYSSGGGGGGATHIAFVPGLLKDLSAYKNTGGTNISNEILMVSGGGGGVMSATPGNGGGISGSKSIAIVPSNTSGNPVGGNTTGGTQTSGYQFGQGQNAIDSNGGGWGCEGNGGAGGGWYGGTASQVTGYYSNDSGAGGSGYIGNSLLKHKYMVGYNVETSDVENTKTLTTTNVSSSAVSNFAKEGNGHARIINLNNQHIEYLRSTKDEFLCEIGGRNYFKYSGEPAICAVVCFRDGGNIWKIPLLVSTSAEAVKFTTSYSSDVLVSNSYINYNGDTYYISNNGNAMGGYQEHTTDLLVLNTADNPFNNLQEAANALLDKYFEN